MIDWTFMLGFLIGILFTCTANILWEWFKSYLDDVKNKQKQIKELQKEIADLKYTISILTESEK